MGTTPVYGWPYEGRDDPPAGYARRRALALAVEQTVQALAATVEGLESRLAAGPRQIVYTAGDAFVKGDHPWARWVRARYVAGGGSGGGAASTGGSENAEGGGGGAGEYAEAWFHVDDLDASETVAIGAGGAPATAGANDGNTGGTTSFAGVTTIGGDGGTGSVAGGGANAAAGGNGGTGGADGAQATSVWRAPGGEGGNGRRLDGTHVRANHGGASLLSGIAVSTPVSSDGRSGREYGGGSSGARNGTSQSARPSEPAADGVIILDLHPVRLT